MSNPGVARVAVWYLALAAGIFTLFRVIEAWVRPHRATALFDTTSVLLVIVGGVLTALALRALARRRHR
jgi:hypothetical protein